MTLTRPGLWPLHDLLGNNLPDDDDVHDYLYSGYQYGQVVPFDDHNYKLKRAGEWHKYLDLLGLRLTDWHDTVESYRLSATSLTYTTGGNILDPNTGATVSTRGVYVVQGTRVETDTAFLNPISGATWGDPLVKTDAIVPGRIWVYADSSGEVRYESAGPADADNPGPDELTLVGLQIDATGEVTNGSLAGSVAPSHWLQYVVPVVHAGAGTRVQVKSAAGVDPSEPAIAVVCEDGPALAATSASAARPAIQATNSSGGRGLHVLAGGATIVGSTSIGGTLSVSGGITGSTATFSGLVQANAGISTTSIGASNNLAVTNNVTIGGTLGVTGAVTCNGDVTIADAALFKTGRVAFSGPVFPDGERQLATLGDGRLIYRRTEDVSVDLIFCSTSGWTYATGEQQEATGFFATNLSLVTAQRIVAQHNTVLVIAEGWGQVNSMGGAIVELQFQYETDINVWEDVGDPVEVKWVDDADAYTWSFFRIARRLNVGTAIGRLYRLKVAATGGAAGKIRESTIRVVNGQR